MANFIGLMGVGVAKGGVSHKYKSSGSLVATELMPDSPAKRRDNMTKLLKSELRQAREESLKRPMRMSPSLPGIATLTTAASLGYCYLKFFYVLYSCQMKQQAYDEEILKVGCSPASRVLLKDYEKPCEAPATYLPSVLELLTVFLLVSIVSHSLIQMICTARYVRDQCYNFHLWLAPVPNADLYVAMEKKLAVIGIELAEVPAALACGLYGTLVTDACFIERYNEKTKNWDRLGSDAVYERSALNKCRESGIKVPMTVESFGRNYRIQSDPETRRLAEKFLDDQIKKHWKAFHAVTVSMAKRR